MAGGRTVVRPGFLLSYLIAKSNAQITSRKSGPSRAALRPVEWRGLRPRVSFSRNEQSNSRLPRTGAKACSLVDAAVAALKRRSSTNRSLQHIRRGPCRR